MAGAASDRKILVYDGDCRMCTRFSRLAEKRWLVGGADRKPVDSFKGDDLVRLYEAGVHNEMAVLDTETREIRTGYDGLLWLLRGGKLRWLTSLITRGPLAWLGRHAYRTIAYNRRLLSPPARGMACACDPDLHRGYRWTLIVWCVLWMALLGSLCTWALLGDPWPSGLGVALAWLLVTPLAARRSPPNGLDYLGHTALSANVMLLPALGGAVALAIWGMDAAGPPRAGPPALTVIWGLSLSLVVRSCLRRLPRLGDSRRAATAVAVVLWAVPAAFVWFVAGQP